MTNIDRKLDSINTEIMVAFIFSIISLSIFLYLSLSAIFPIIEALIVSSSISSVPIFGSIAMATSVATIIVALLPILIFVSFAFVSTFVSIRLNRMRNAVAHKDIQQLKELNSTGWAIAAIIFGGVIPGIMMLIAYSEIDTLPETIINIQPAPTFTPGAMDKIIQLKHLVDSGAITQQDFEEQKQRILFGTTPQHESPEMEELRKLKGLLDCNAITEEEYKIQKQKILNLLNISAQATAKGTCPYCHAINPENTRFCENCGTALTA